MVDWTELTHDCLLNVLARLPLRDRWFGAMLVCKTWLRAFKDPSLNRSLDLEPWFEWNPCSPRWLDPEFQRTIDAMVRNVVERSEGGVVKIRVPHCSGRSALLVAERCPNLQVLSIKSSRVSEKIFVSMVVHLTNLKELDISSCYQIDAYLFILIGMHCPNLKTLKRNFISFKDSNEHAQFVGENFHDVGDIEATVIGINLKGLEHLELRYSKMTVRGLFRIAAGCMELKYLDLLGCFYLMYGDFENAFEERIKLRKVEKRNWGIPRIVHPCTHRLLHWEMYAYGLRRLTDVLHF
ncbi:unnamed protein product [Rhodiola kirilowii]